MSKKRNSERGGKKVKNTPGVSMKRHGKSGVPHNHSVSIARVREENQRLEKERKLRELRKGKMYSSISELFNQK